MSDTTNKTDNAPAPEENGEKKKEDTAKSQDASGTEQNPAGEKFRSFTRKVTSSAEKIIGASYKTAKTAILNVKFKPQAGVKVLDKFLKFIRSILSEELFDKIAETSVKYGHMAISASQILVVLFGIRASIRTGNWRFTIYSLMGVLIFMVLQYTAHKFLNAGHSLINSSPSKLSSETY
ncbi:MAG TPA: hypothetical protein PLK94_10985, partial [Alphaproteobacteria bacterium]|nr:hypothetical protein [Alphaproteobacteria bacterium]